MKRTRITALAAAVLLLTGCGHSIGENSSIAEVSEASSEASSETASETASEAVTTTAPVSDSSAESVTTTVEAEKKITAVETAFKEYSQTAEAEELKELPEGVKSAKKRKNFTGECYLTGLNSKHSVTFEFDLPESQYYSIALTVAADKESKCTLTVGETPVGEFTVPGDGKFTLVTLKNIYAEKGKAQFALLTSKGAVDLDSITVTASSDVRDLKLSLGKASLVNKNADVNARALYEYICQSYGKTVLTGQHDTVGTMTETRRISEITGRYPAVRFGDLMPFTQDMIIGENELEYAEKWAEDGGIVGYMWHWLAPGGGKSCYADESDFDLSKAVTKEKIYDLSLADLKKLKKEKKISAECLAIIEDIDKVSEKLAELRDKGIAVLWRPLHEASNGYFWWSKDESSYIWLWKLLYQRQTNYHKLNNLIWVWSAQDDDWYVGDRMCDIVSADIYDKGNTAGQVEKLLFLRDITANKPIAMAECGTTPSIQSMADQHALWSYVGQWGGSYLLNEDISLNEEYNTLESLVKFYSNDLTVTREELPDLKARAAELAKAGEEKKPAETTAKDKDSSEKETVKTEKTTKAPDSSEESGADTTTKKTTAKTTKKTASETAKKQAD